VEMHRGWRKHQRKVVTCSTLFILHRLCLKLQYHTSTWWA